MTAPCTHAYVLGEPTTKVTKLAWFILSRFTAVSDLGTTHGMSIEYPSLLVRLICVYLGDASRGDKLSPDELVDLRSTAGVVGAARLSEATFIGRTSNQLNAVMYRQQRETAPLCQTV